MWPIQSSLLYPFALSGYALALLGALRKITHQPDADTWLTIGFIMVAVFTALVVFEVMRSRRIAMREKVAWAAGLILANLLTAIVYLAVGRKRVVEAD